MLMKRLSVMYGGLSIATVVVGAIVQIQRGKAVAGMFMLGYAVFLFLNVRSVARNIPGALRNMLTIAVASVVGCVLNFITGPRDILYFSIALSGFQGAAAFAAWRASNTRGGRDAGRSVK